LGREERRGARPAPGRSAARDRTDPLLARPRDQSAERHAGEDRAALLVRFLHHRRGGRPDAGPAGGVRRAPARTRPLDGLHLAHLEHPGRAAIRRAHKRGELLAAPFIADVETAEDRRVKDPKGRPITVEELAALFDAARHDHLFMFLLLACCTLARPDAILDLTVFQRDRESGTLNLNPAGRRQTKKYRPLILEAKTLTPWLDQVTTEHFVAWNGRRLKSIKTAWCRLRAHAELDERVTPYSIRHTVARELRRRRVPLEQRQHFLGHLPRGSARTTAIYAPDEPEYLTDAVEAIDGFMMDVDRVAARSIVLRASCVLVPKLKVVGAGGIEPPTPTMST
jgi:hypothetical protein